MSGNAEKFALRPILDAWVAIRQESELIPGLSIAVARGGRVVYTKQVGLADMQHHTRTNSRTCFPVASISKTFTAIAILQLVADGKISLTASPSRYLPNLRVPKSLLHRLTIDRLLHHTAGVWRDGDTDQWTSDVFPTGRQVVDSLRRATHWPKPVAGFKYSNFGYAVLGAVIESVSGLTYAEYVTKNILHPLRLHHTYPDYAPSIPNLAVGYPRLGVKKQSPFPHTATRGYAAATGFISTAADLAQFASTLTMERLTIVPKKYRRLLLDPTTRTGVPKERYGYGISSWRIDKESVIGHSGGFAGFTSQYVYAPKPDLSVSVIGNRMFAPTGGIAGGAMRLIREYDDAPSPQTSRYKKFAGLYESRWGLRMIIPHKQTLLVFGPEYSDPLSMPARLIPTSEKNRFTISLKERYDASGEPAWFTESRGTTFWWAGSPLKIVKRIVL